MKRRDKFAFKSNMHLKKNFHIAQLVKNLPAMLETWVRKIPWRRKWQPTPVFWPGEFHGQRSLTGYSPWSCEESDTTERLTLTEHVNIFRVGVL